MTREATNDRSERLARILDRLTQMRDAAETGGRTETSPAVVRAPGRVNLIGEYTDINRGFVLPAAIDLEAWIAFRASLSRRVELRSEQLGEPLAFDLDRLAPETAVPGWGRYVAGTAWAMREAGLPVQGFTGVLDSSIPIGSGLSSSAAIEMASTWALHDPGEPRLPPAEMALVAQRAENRYVGVNSGIMDQYASAAGRARHALLIDCRSLDLEYVPLPPGVALVVCDTSSPHRLEASAYNERRRECEDAARVVAEREPAVKSLRDVTPEMLEQARDRMPEIVARRAEHIVRENERVLAAVAAFRAGDSDALGRLFAASHASLRDLFEVSSPELDALVEIASSVPGVIATRMTGAGFGGCTVNVVEEGAQERLEAEVLRRYPKMTGLTPSVYRVAIVDGAGFVTESPSVVPAVPARGEPS